MNAHDLVDSLMLAPPGPAVPADDVDDDDIDAMAAANVAARAAALEAEAASDASVFDLGEGSVDDDDFEVDPCPVH